MSRVDAGGKRGAGVEKRGSPLWPRGHGVRVRRIGVLTSDFALYHDLVRLLRDRRIPFSSLSFGERPDPTVGVVVTSWQDSVSGRLPEDVPLVVVPVDRSGAQDLDAALVQAQRVLEGVQGYGDVVIGVDPGPRPGVALLADGRLVQTAQVFRVADVAPLVRSLLRQYPHERGVVRVGHQAPRERDAIVAALWPLRDEEGVRVEIADESGTTPETGATPLPPDVAAAVAIARTPGRAPARPPRSRVPEGHVREVQRSSRIASGGRVTISRAEAERVLRGERSLPDAIHAEEAKRLRSRRDSSEASEG
jgi:hypothetical protein